MPSAPKNRTEASQGAAASLLNGLRVLEAFRTDAPSLGVTEVSQIVDLHKSTVSRILSGLAEAGYVERESQSGRYRLGLGVIGLAGPLLAELDVRRLAFPILEALTLQTRETSALSVWNGTGAVVVEQVSSPQFVKHTAYIGTRYDRYESSSVRVFLALLAEGAVSQLLETNQISRAATSGLGTDVSAHLKEVRTEGLAFNDGYTDSQEFGVSAPVYDYRGTAVGCVTLSAPRGRISMDQRQEFGQAVKLAAEKVSDRLGGKHA